MEELTIHTDIGTLEFGTEYSVYRNATDLTIVRAVPETFVMSIDLSIVDKVIYTLDGISTELSLE